MKYRNHDIKILACNAGVPFAKKVLPYLNDYLKSDNYDETEIVPVEEVQFNNTEIKVNIVESIRGCDVYIFQDIANSTKSWSVDEKLRSLKNLIHTASMSNAHKIYVVIPTFPYARQDKRWGRECLTAKLVAQELELAGADYIITLDLHNPLIEGFFDKAILENLHGGRNLSQYIKDNIDTSNLVVSSPDTGGIKRAVFFASKLRTPMVTIYKDRNYCKLDCIDKMELIGNVENKDVLLVDDMLDTGGTIYNAIKLLKEKGANKIYFSCSLPFFNGNAYDRINELYNDGILDSVITTDAVYHGDDFLEKNMWCKQVTVADYFAKVIFNLHTYRSIHNLLTED